ncbi:type II secretion system protein GspG [Verrucomicrobiaceae bacterium N1E253]|uniref:Type II secretion system protein GspG n=1 Tax=Oceaniferula marina TaxID=2748318 RepID=A0A851GKR4_9BACT|nr:type II secretion system protein GspG [Oceaniferula marina]NWK57729.1 type II secretion system protein GspG [Oceaniferula marina]
MKTALASLMVIILIALLSVLVIQKRNTVVHFVHVDGELNTVASALDSYRRATGDYPTTEQGLDALVNRPQREPVPSTWVQIFKEEPLDPWGRGFCYSYEENGYVLWSQGKDEACDSDDVYYSP